jgi:hypothetical protein
LVVEQEGYGVREDFAQQPACEMPHVARPHPLYGIALCELAENTVYPVTKPTEEGTLFRGRISLLGGVWSQKLHTHARQLLPGLRRVVVALSDDQPRGKLGDLWEQGELVSVGWSHRKTSDHPRPGETHTCRKRPPLASVGLGTTERREISFLIQPFGETCTRG